jgi:hypothetical protein
MSMSIFMSISMFISLYMYLNVSISTSTSASTSTSTSMSLPIHLSIYLSIYLSSYLSIYLSIDRSIYLSSYLPKRFALSSRWCSMPKPTPNQSRICSTPTLFKEILNQHDDNIQWSYCASSCLNLYSTCFQGACRVVSHSTQHLACENRIK